MNSTLPSSLNKPSEFYTAVVDGLKTKLSADVDVLRYANFNTQEVQGIQLYVEIGDFGHAIRHPDGRRAQKMRINVHCIVSRGIEEADLKALDLASAVDRIVDVNCWELGEAVEVPENVSGNEGMMSTGENAFEGWEVSWYQTIYLGEVSIFDPAVKDVLMSVNPESQGSSDEYERVPDAGTN